MNTKSTVFVKRYPLKQKLSIGWFLTFWFLSASAISQQATQDEAVDCSLEANRNNSVCQELKTDGLVDEIVVTGSYFQRDKFTSPSPVEVISVEAIEEYGSATIGEFIRDLSFTNGSNTINNPGDNQNGLGGDRQDGANTSFNLRGFGQDGTLTLVDGVRTSQASFDANNLAPTIALQRVEVLLDGGGGLYGTDAIAGVVNLITLKKFDGFRANAYYGGDGGDYGDSRFSFVTGTNIGNFDVVTSFEASNRTTLSVLERPQYARAAQTGSTAGSPGRYSVGGFVFLTPDGQLPNRLGARTFADPYCGDPIPGQTANTDPGKALYQPTGLSSGNSCLFFLDEYRDYLPAVERYVSNTTFSYEFNDNLSVSYNLALNWREVKERTSPFSRGQSPFLVVPANAPGVVDLVSAINDPMILAAGTPVNIDTNWRPFGKAGVLPSTFNPDGSRDNITETYTDRHRITVDYDFGDSSWSGSFNATTSTSRTQQIEDVVLMNRLTAALNGLGGPNCSFNDDQLIGITNFAGRQAILTDPANTALAGTSTCRYFNPFGSALVNPNLANDQELVDWMVQEVDYRLALSEFDSYGARVQGEVFDLPAGPIESVVGIEVRDSFFTFGNNPHGNQQNDFNDTLNLGNTSFVFTEKVESVFTEVKIPILDQLDFSVAARREDYVDRPFGATTKPKYSLSYRPLEDLALRLSYGESFTAPRADELNESNEFVFPIFGTTDPFANAMSGVAAASGDNVFTGNGGLRPEESETINIGASYRGIENWEFNIDLQEIKFFDRVERQSGTELLNRQFAQFQASGGDVNNPAEVRAFLEANPNPDIERNENLQVTRLILRPTNLDDITAQFVDFKVTFKDVTTDWGYFETSWSATTYIKYDYVPIQNFDGTTEDAVGQRNRDVSAASALPRWKSNVNFRWLKGDNSVVARINYVDAIDFDGEVAIGATAPETINSFTTLDLRYGHSFNELLDGTVLFSAGISNVFDREAQPLPVDQGLETRLQDPIGRTFYLDMTYDF